MLRIFQTGDNHIGLKYASHPQAKLLAERRIEAFKTMVDAANREGCGLFVICGDLFENISAVAKRDVKAVVDMLTAFDGTVAVLPGNHDYYDRDAKIWQQFREAAAHSDNILLLCEYRPYSLNIGGESVVLYPAHCSSRHSKAGENNLGWLKNEPMADRGSYHIGIAHGAVEGESLDSEGQYFLMTRRELESIGVDVWLIGHTHVPFPAGLSGDYAPADRILNPGTHVQTDVSCGSEGLCFIIELDGDRSPCVKKLVSGNIRFYRRYISLTAGQAEENLLRQLRDIEDNSVVDIILSGAVSQEEYEQADAMAEAALSRFVEGTYDAGGLSRLISKELIDAEFAETSLAAGLLTALLPEPKEAQLAYELLKALKGERK